MLRQVLMGVIGHLYTQEMLQLSKLLVMSGYNSLRLTLEKKKK